MMRQVIVVTSASSGIGALSVRALAHARHTVYAGIPPRGGKHPRGHNTGAVGDAT